MKKCPFCAGDIQDEAIKCKHCGEFLHKDKQQSTIDQKIEWFYYDYGNRGPMTLEKLKDAYARNKISDNTEVWANGESAHVPLKDHYIFGYIKGGKSTEEIMLHMKEVKDSRKVQESDKTVNTTNEKTEDIQKEEVEQANASAFNTKNCLLLIVSLFAIILIIAYVPHGLWVLLAIALFDVFLRKKYKRDIFGRRFPEKKKK